MDKASTPMPTVLPNELVLVSNDSGVTCDILWVQLIIRAGKNIGMNMYFVQVYAPVEQVLNEKLQWVPNKVGAANMHYMPAQFHMGVMVLHPVTTYGLPTRLYLAVHTNYQNRSLKHLGTYEIRSV
jgi:hypothetical protein